MGRRSAILSRFCFRFCFYVAFVLPLVKADFGDYVDPTFDCPAHITCLPVCAASEGDCPLQLTCSNGSTLCPDGSCAATCDASLPNLCEENSCGKNITCARIVLSQPDCTLFFREWYTNATEGETCVVDEVELLDFKGADFVIFYAFFGAVCFLIVAYPAFNQRFFPIGDTVPLDDFSKESLLSGLPTEHKGWTQTSVRKTLLGSFLFFLTSLTLWGIQVLLLILVVFYYRQQRGEFKPITLNPFQDEIQVLKAFQIVWMVGLVFSLCLQWPPTMESLFLRRCVGAQATFVAVFAPSTAPELKTTTSNRGVAMVKGFMNSVNKCFTTIFAFLFSDVIRPKHIRGGLHYCPVLVDADGTRSFFFRLRRYVYSEETGCYVPGILEVGSTLKDFQNCIHGLTESEANHRRSKIGHNSIDLKKPSFFVGIIEEFSKTFYIYQNFITWGWLNYWYYYMGIVQTIVRVTGGLAVAYIKYVNDCNLYRLSLSFGEVKVLRDGAFVTLPQKAIVPGDVIVVSPGIACCDMILISSDNVIVEESALTGEANPVAKAQIDVTEGTGKRYDPKAHKKYTIFAGTNILESNPYDQDLAVVTHTGTFTAKGELLRDILFYERHRFKFDVEVELVVAILLLYAVFAFSITIHILGESEWVYGWFYALYVLAAALPPLLPTVFVVSVGISSQRLITKDIAVADSGGILVAGKVRIAFFDKTGTLTRQGLEFSSMQGAEGGKWIDSSEESVPPKLRLGMTVCHTLTKSRDGSLLGNSVDCIMFQATDATFEQVEGKPMKVTDSGGQQITVIKRFEFDYHRMTQSVLVKTQENKLLVLVKGSIDSVSKLCSSDSLPVDCSSLAAKAARDGIYQISIAIRSCGEATPELEDKFATMDREDFEKELSFIGFVNFKNTLKEDSAEVLKVLEEGDVRCYMVTGDSVLTGICIAKECGIIHQDGAVILGNSIDDQGNIMWVDWTNDEVVKLPPLNMLNQRNGCLAMKGSVWAALPEDMKKTLAPFIRVYGRCTPHDKVSVVATFVDMGFVTLMCGDGGNDCGALKTAHVGIALSDAEASVVAPFTSLNKSISSVVEVLKEGRCALASSFAAYKYMVMYGQVEVINQVANAWFNITFAEWNWVFMDGIWVLCMAFTLPLAQAAKNLANTRPTSSLFGLHTMLSACGVLAINFIFVVIALSSLLHQDWYQCRRWGSSDISSVLVIGDNYESSVLFLVSGLQYISSAMAYNFGYEHRASWFMNWRFAILSISFTFMQFYIALVPGSLSCLFRVNCVNDDVVRQVTSGKNDLLPIQNPYATTVMPLDFRWTIAGIMFANLVSVMIWEYFFVNGIFKHCKRKKKEIIDSENALVNDGSSEW